MEATRNGNGVASAAPAWRVIQGHCVESMRTMPDASIDAVVTDPPYGLSREPDIAEVLTHWLAGDDYVHRGGGFMGRSWDSFVPGPVYWREAFRVLKPGGHLLAFTSTRTSDLLGIAIRLAGFERRDTIVYMFGSGFPKALDVSKAIDGAAGAEREVIGRYTSPEGTTGQSNGNTGVYGQYDGGALSPVTAPSTPEAERWQGWATSLKPAHEPIVVARKPLTGTVAANVCEFGTGALNVDATRIEGAPDAPGSTPATLTNDGTQTYGKRTRAEYDVPSGRWPANVVLTHDEGCVPIGTRHVKANGSIAEPPSSPTSTVYGDRERVRWQAHGDRDGTETVSAWECVEGCPVRLLDEQTGDVSFNPAGEFGKRGRAGTILGNGLGIAGSVREERDVFGYGDSGGASRFFYTAKASTRERNAGLESLAVHDGKMCACPDHKDQAVSPPRGTSEPIVGVDCDSFITGSGSSTTEPSPMASRSTIETRSRPTTGLRTSNSSPPSITSASTPPTTGATPPASGSDGARSARNGRLPTPSTTTSAPKAGPSTADADPATSGSSSSVSSSAGVTCPDCGGVIEGAWRNTHPLEPTVKPIDLMRWLVRLVAPPGGIVLDMFAGSGTTGCAAVLEGFDFIGLEREPEYVTIAEARIAWWAKQPPGIDTAKALGEDAALTRRAEAGDEKRRETEAAGQGSIFDLLGDAS